MPFISRLECNLCILCKQEPSDPYDNTFLGGDLNVANRLNCLFKKNKQKNCCCNYLTGAIHLAISLVAFDIGGKQFLNNPWSSFARKMEHTRGSLFFTLA